MKKISTTKGLTLITLSLTYYVATLAALMLHIGESVQRFDSATLMQASSSGSLGALTSVLTFPVFPILNMLNLSQNGWATNIGLILNSIIWATVLTSLIYFIKKKVSKG